MQVSAFSDHSVHPMDFARPHLDAFLTVRRVGGLALTHAGVLSLLRRLHLVCDVVAISGKQAARVRRDHPSSLTCRLGMAGHDHDRHQVSFVLDKSVMFHVISSRNGQKHEHRIKALDIIWQKVC